MSRQSILGFHGDISADCRWPSRRYRRQRVFRDVCPQVWGIKALGGYLGQDRQVRKHDAVALIEDGAHSWVYWSTMAMPIHSHRTAAPGTAAERLRENSMTLRRQPGYDHSYYFISTSWTTICAGMPRD